MGEAPRPARGGDRDGPRAARPDELNAVVALCDAAFRRPPYTTSMAEDFPALFTPANAPNLRVVADAGGALLAHAGSVRGHMRMGAFEVAAAAHGAVTTRADLRGQGLGSALVADAMRVLAADGVAVLTISGDRSLYLRAGAAPAGRCCRWRVPLGDGGAGGEDLGEPGHLGLRPPVDWRELAALHAREPVRWRRGPATFAAEGYARSIQCRQSAWVVEADGRAAAYWVAGVPDRGQRPRDMGHVVEFGGERTALAVTMDALCRALGVRALTLSTTDPTFEGLLARRGLTPQVRALPGTVAVLRPDLLAAAAGWRGPPAGADPVATFFGRAGLARDPGLPPPLPLPWPNGLDYA